MKAFYRTTLLSIAALLCLSVVMASETTSAGKAAGSKTISKEQARAIAKQKFPDGTLESAELETENGALIWSVDVRSHGSTNIHELQIDAFNGHIIKTEIETPADQAAEKAADLAAEKATMRQ